MKILVVDDDADIAAEVCTFLKRRGHEPSMATGARAGTALLACERFAAVLTDMRMPDGSGLDVLRAAGADNRVPLKLVMTGHATDDDLAEARRLGAQRIFTKPVSLRSILAALDMPEAA